MARKKKGVPPKGSQDGIALTSAFQERGQPTVTGESRESEIRYYLQKKKGSMGGGESLMMASRGLPIKKFSG